MTIIGMNPTTVYCDEHPIVNLPPILTLSRKTYYLDDALFKDMDEIAQAEKKGFFDDKSFSVLRLKLFCVISCPLRQAGAKQLEEQFQAQPAPLSRLSQNSGQSDSTSGYFVSPHTPMHLWHSGNQAIRQSGNQAIRQSGNQAISYPRQ